MVMITHRDRLTLESGKERFELTGEDVLSLIEVARKAMAVSGAYWGITGVGEDRGSPSSSMLINGKMHQALADMENELGDLPEASAEIIGVVES